MDKNILLERKWAMPNKNTFDIKPIKELIEEEMTDGLWIDPFANKNKFATITNDLNPEYDTDYHLDAIDFLKMFEDNSVDGVLFDPPYCYDNKTEIFTSKGFKNISALTKEDLLATINTDTENFEYQHPTEIISKVYTGKMIKFKSKYVDLLVTPNHRCYIKDATFEDYYWTTAEKILLNSKQVFFKKNCNWINEFPNKTITINGKEYNSMDWMKLFAYFVSCGYIVENERQCYIKNDFKKCRKELIDLLNKMSIPFIQSMNKIFIEDWDLKLYFRNFYLFDNCLINEDYRLFSESDYAIFIKYLYFTQNGKHLENTNKMFSVALREEELEMLVTEFALKAGYSLNSIVNRRNKFIVELKKGNNFIVNTEEIKCADNPTGIVYCVSVPNKILLVRRNGKICWCGNSPRQVSECYKELGKTVNMQTTQASFWGNIKKEIARVVKPNGKVMSFGWNSGGIGKTNGFDITRILLVPHGGWHNDTICTVETKQSNK